MNGEILKKAYEMKEYVTEIRRHIHENPELGMQEFETTKLVKKELQKIGVEIVELKSKTGVLGIIKGTKKGENRVIGIRADMDALPINEKTSLEYSSKNHGIMHACGHDGHTAMLIGAARLLSTMKDQFSGTVKLIFQPNEEATDSRCGATFMINEGVLENPKVDAIVALHMWPQTTLGKIGLWTGPYMASMDTFHVTITGSGGHGAYPHKTPDPILATAHCITALQSIISREIDAMENAVISVCTTNSGTATNIIPREVTFSGTVRCKSESVRNVIEGKMNRIIKGIAESFQCEYKLKYEYHYPPLVNHPEFVQLVSEAAEEVLGEGCIEPLATSAMSSENFSLMLEKVPFGAFIRLGITAPGEKPVTPHSETFDFNDDAIPYGIALLTQIVMNRNI
ncbi:MAG TPA: M20 family metallopeptidase [Bacillota bacterium]|nr:M20 family metallopeptidase [Bacillota bacterium]